MALKKEQAAQDQEAQGQAEQPRLGLEMRRDERRQEEDKAWPYLEKRLDDDRRKEEDRRLAEKQNKKSDT